MSRKKSRTDSAATEPRPILAPPARALIANATNDITIPFYSGVLQHADDTLIQRGGGIGLKIYDEIERDTHAFAMLQKRKKHLLAREWMVEAASDDPRDIEAATVVRSILRVLPFDRICEDLLDATLKGFAISEIVWARAGDRIVPARIVSHDQRRFAFDQDWKPRLLTWSNMRDGIELPERKFIVHRHGVKGNNPYGLGLGTRLFWPVLFKREGVAFWLHFLEKFAGPTVIAETPYGTVTEEQRNLLNSLKDIRTSSAMVVPVGTGVKFLEAARSGSVTYQNFLDYWDKQIAICVNGETLTTDIGSGGSRAASETHADMLAMLVDSDGDLLSDSLREQLIAWIVDYNCPGAKTPGVWRVRPESEKEKAAARKSTADAALASAAALTDVLIAAANIDDDDQARDFLTSFGLTNEMEEATVNALIGARRGFVEEGDPKRRLHPGQDRPPAFAADLLKKKDHDHLCFASGSLIDRLGDQLEAQTEAHFRKRLAAVRTAIAAPDFDAAARNLLALAAIWTPDALATQLEHALTLSALEGREAVFRDAEGEAVSHAAEVVSQPFLEQIEFLRQKRAKPTKAWTDAMYGMHDRAFVVAGATDIALVEDFQKAIIRSAETQDIREFAATFDELVEKYGWSYNGGRNWRIRTIFRTNIRTSYMAGRLKQMRDPAVIKLRPYWQYLHADIREPLNPREQHVAWDRMVLNWDDPWWNTHFPPNDWLCSCGVKTLSRGDLRRLGKAGPDKAPPIVTRPYTHEASGVTVELPEGIGYGWDYMPGDAWERGLVPSQLLDEAGGLSAVRQLVEIDTPAPLEDLIAAARPFVSPRLASDLPADELLRAFMEMFDATPDQAVLHEDQAGGRIPISADLFRASRTGELKIGKRDRSPFLLWLAETILEPDEIWIGLNEKPNPTQRCRRGCCR